MDKKVKLFANATEKINTKKYTQKIRRETSRKKKSCVKKGVKSGGIYSVWNSFLFFLFRLFDVLATKILLHWRNSKDDHLKWRGSQFASTTAVLFSFTSLHPSLLSFLHPFIHPYFHFVFIHSSMHIYWLRNEWNWRCPDLLRRYINIRRKSSSAVLHFKCTQKRRQPSPPQKYPVGIFFLPLSSDNTK